MNLVEHYIVTIHSETLSKDGKFIIVDLTYDCYGCLKRTTEEFLISTWDKIKEDGYFLA